MIIKTLSREKSGRPKLFWPLIAPSRFSWELKKFWSMRATVGRGGF